MNTMVSDDIESDDEDILDTEMSSEEIIQDVEMDETVETIEVEDVEEIEIDMDESTGWVGGDNTRHYSLYGRDEQDQHPITAITGLREELNDIEALDVVYSDERNQANYYLWKDKNILQENRVGYFVSACEDINEIEMCTSSNDIFGVTVDGAGFIGAQSDVARDIKYGLVVTTGVVHVRCESSVNVGDYVVSNDYGYATKNKNGYKVVGRHLIDGVEYAEITLTTPINRICQLSDDVEDVNQRMDDAETNIVAAINVANAAYNKAIETDNISGEALKDALEALNKSNNASEKTSEFEQRLTQMNEMMEQSKSIAESAVVAADKIQKEAVSTANNALAEVLDAQKDISDLATEMTPLSQWASADGKQSGIVGFVARANADSATLATLAEWKEEGGDNQSLAGTIAKVNEHQSILDHITSKQGVNGSTIAKVEQKADDNTASITSIVASVDKYSVGEYSQAYGLTREQAASILQPGYIYIPTKHGSVASHSETMWENSEEQKKGDNGIKETNEFTSEDYYVWGINDQGKADWIEHSEGSVWISNAIPANSNGKLKYWYVDSNTPPQGYEAYALYIWEDSQWKKINTLAGNASNRAVSMIRQTTNEIAAEVTNARGSYAGLSARLEADNEAQTALIAKVVNPQTGEIKSASIINAVTNGESSTAITADHIVLNGYNISNGDGSFAIDKYGCIQATGGYIGGWCIEPTKFSGLYYDNFGKELSFYIQSNPYDPDNTAYPYNPVIAVKYDNDDKFYVRSNGYLYSKYGEIAGWNIAENSLWKSSTDPNGKSFNFYIQSNPYDPDNTAYPYNPVIAVKYDNDDKFYVRSNGYLYSKYGEIAGWNIADKQLYVEGDTWGAGINAYGAGPAFWAGTKGSTNGSDAAFHVFHDGSLYASKGNIAGWEINGSTLRKSSGDYLFYLDSNPYTEIPGGIPYNPVIAVKYQGDYKFYVRSNGHLFAKDAEIEGKITATDGTIGGWRMDESRIYNYNATTGYTFSLWNPGIAEGHILSCSNGTNYPFYITRDGSLYAQKATIQGTLKAGSIIGEASVGKETGGFSYQYKIPDTTNGYFYSLSGAGYDVYNDGTPGDVLINEAQSGAFSVQVSNVRGRMCSLSMTGESGSLVGNWIGTSGKILDSDQNLKHDIEPLSDKYSMFFDALEPKRFKYNDGTSNRYHTGFIAQDVYDAFNNAGLDSQEVGAYVHIDRSTYNDEHLGLRYEEFIALNTMQIQKAKSRITELEEKVAELESLIKGE